MAPVVVISRRTVDRGLDLLNEAERFRCKPGVLHDVAGETNELGREFVDGPNHLGRILRVALVMEVSEMDKAAIAPAAGQIEFGYAQRGRFDKAGIHSERRRERQRGQAEEFSPSHPAHASNSESI